MLAAAHNHTAQGSSPSAVTFGAGSAWSVRVALYTRMVLPHMGPKHGRVHAPNTQQIVKEQQCRAQRTLHTQCNTTHTSVPLSSVSYVPYPDTHPWHFGRLCRSVTVKQSSAARSASHRSDAALPCQMGTLASHGHTHTLPHARRRSAHSPTAHGGHCRCSGRRAVGTWYIRRCRRPWLCRRCRRPPHQEPLST